MFARARGHRESTGGRSWRYLAYAHAGQYTVDGWLRRTGLALIETIDGLQRQNSVLGNVAEIGVHHGRLFIVLSLLRRPGEHAVAIDIFEDQVLNVDGSGFGDRERLQANLRRWDPRSSDVRIVKADSRSLRAADLLRAAGGPLRLVSVDGGHTAELTRHDLTTGCESLAEGGVLILDDCFNGLFPAVGEAAHDFLHENPQFQIIAVGGNKTLICRREAAAAYRDQLGRRLSRRRFDVLEGQFVSQPLLVVRSRRWFAQPAGRTAGGATALPASPR